MDPNKLVKGPNTVSSRPVSTYADRRSTPASISSTTDALIQGWVIPDIPAADEAQKQDLSLSSWGQVLEEQVNQKLFREDVLEAMKKRAKTPMQSKTASSQRSNRSTLNPTEYMYELAAMTSAESPLWDFKEYKPKERLASSSEPQPGPASRKESFLQSIAIELEDPVIPRTESISLIEAPLPPIFESHAPVDDDDKSQQVKVEEKPTKVARAFSLTPLPPLPVTYSPPEAPIDMSALLKREDELMDELALKRRTLASVQGELEMLDEDLLLHDAQETLVRYLLVYTRVDLRR